MVTLNATTGSTPVNVVLTSDQLARLTDSAHSHYIHYLADPADDARTLDGITTDADLLDGDGEPIDATTPIDIADNKKFNQITVNPDADGRFTITFDTATVLNSDIIDDNVALQTALMAFVDDPDVDDDLASTIETAAEAVRDTIANSDSTPYTD